MAHSAQFDMNDILENLDKFSLKAEGKGIVLFLGETGSGKSTLTQFIAGSRHLASVGENGNFTIQDTIGRISSREEASKSKTIYPELLSYADSDGETLLMDTPGFEDTRSSEMEINCTLHMKNALRYFPMLKIVLVISYDDIKIGGRREGFVRLIKNATTLLKNYNYFQKSIGLIVTKIPPITVKVGTARMLISDETWKQHIESALTNLGNTIKNETNIPQERKSTYKSAIKVIEILLGSDYSENDSSAIEIFRTPEEGGLIYDMKPFPECREALRKLVSNLQYASVRADDFGYTISDFARQSIANEIYNIVKTITKAFDVVLTRIDRSYNEFEKCEKNFHEILREFQNQNRLWEQKFNQINKMTKTSEVLNFLLKMLKDQVERPLVAKHSATGAQNADLEIFENLSKYAKFLDILELVSNTKSSVTTKSWETLFQRTKKMLREGDIWYELISIITRMLQFDVKSSKDSEKACRFLRQLEKWINADQPVPGELFKSCFIDCCQHGMVIQIKYDISVVKLQKLLNHLETNNVVVVPEERITKKDEVDFFEWLGNIIADAIRYFSDSMKSWFK